MPRAKRASRKKLSFDINADMLEHFLTGYLCLEFERDKGLAERLWKRCGELVTAEFAKVLPGARPYSWWKFDSPEPRKAVQGTAFYDRHPEVFRKFCFGITPLNDDEDTVYEDEIDYLLRLDLLTHDEANNEIELLRRNSCDSFRRRDKFNIEKIMQNLGVI